jgi:hypothetical protein
MGKLMKAVMNKVRGLTTKAEKYQEAITFAEAGHHEHARDLMQERHVELEPRRLLVVGRESSFSNDIITYALDMAQRMSYQILALNTAPLSCETHKFFPARRNELCGEFQKMSEENVREFQDHARELGIAFAHVVKFTEQDEALEEISKEFKDIEFVVSETAEEQATQRAKDSKRPGRGVYVYTIH